MTPRERFVRTLTFGEKPDRIFYQFGHPRKATLQAWRLQGLPPMPDAGDYGCPKEFCEMIGEDPILGVPIKTDTFPPFEVRIIRETERSRVWVDGHGITMEDAGDHLTTPGFRTRKYVAHPVTDQASWRRMRDEHFDPFHPGRCPPDWQEQARKLRSRELPLQMTMAGLYWKARDWCGFENLSVMFYDNPTLVHEMMEHRAWFIMEIFKRYCADLEVDCVCISEDMCYKHAMMISPKTFREFMLPHYRKMAECFRSHGVKVLSVDSDGHNGQLIPLLIEAGFNCINPMEIAANNDPVAYRKKYGRSIAFWGGIDKRELTTKDRVYREVMSKVPWLVEQGGYRPGVDHGVPPTVHLRGYLYMVELIKAIAERRHIPLPSEPLELEQKLGPIERMWSVEMELRDEDAGAG